MYVIHGQQNYGKVDIVPKLFYVTTKFFHVYYVPLVPLASFVFTTGKESSAKNGLPLSLCWKSVLAAWVRAVLVLCILAGVGYGSRAAFEVAEGRRDKAWDELEAAVCLCVFSAGAFWVTKISAKASPARAYELGKILGLDQALIERQLGVQPDDFDSTASQERDRAT